MFEGHRHAADVLFVAQVLQKIAVDRGHAILEHVLVEREYLALDVCAEVLRVLQEHAAHDDLDLRAILLADQVLAFALVVHTPAQRILNPLLVLRREKNLVEPSVLVHALQRLLIERQRGIAAVKQHQLATRNVVIDEHTPVSTPT